MEVKRRERNSLHDSHKAFESIYTAVEKLAQPLKKTVEQCNGNGFILLLPICETADCGHFTSIIQARNCLNKKFLRNFICDVIFSAFSWLIYRRRLYKAKQNLIMSNKHLRSVFEQEVGFVFLRKL